MASFSFPHPFPSQGNNDHNNPFSVLFAPQHTHDGSSAGATFTVNPASSHPPSKVGSVSFKTRTPRTSIINSHVDGEKPANISPYDINAYGKEEVQEAQATEKAISAPSRKSRGRARVQEVWKEMFLTSNGRDKALKIIQYSIRVYLLFHIRTSGLFRDQKLGWEKDILDGLNKAYSGLSLTRKCLILFNWLGPLSIITAPQTMPLSSIKGKVQERPLLHKLLHASPPVLLDLVCGISDDAATCYKLGLLPDRIGVQAERMADWCWFASTLVGLVEVGVEDGIISSAIRDIESRLYGESMAGPGAVSVSGQATDEQELVKLRNQRYWLRVSRAKLLMDLIFVSYDVFHLKRWKDSAKGFSGLASAVLSSMKLYDKHHSSLARSLV